MRTFTLFIAFLLMLAGSVFCWMAILAEPTSIAALIRALPRLYDSNAGKLSLIALGMLTFSSSVALFAAMLGIEPGVRKPVVIKDESGTVGISLDAIEEFVKRKGSSVRGIRDLTVSVDVVDGGLAVQNRVVLELQRNVPDFTHEFIGMLNRELKETLGLDNVKDVSVLIHKLFPKEGPKEPMLLAGPKPVVLRSEEEPGGEPPERGYHSNDEVVTISPNEFRGKENKG